VGGEEQNQRGETAGDEVGRLPHPEDLDPENDVANGRVAKAVEIPWRRASGM
jgi:hypothetical protein